MTVLIVLGLAQLDQHDLIVEFLLDARQRAELVIERGALLHDAGWRAADRSKDRGLRPAGSVPRAARAPCRRQRCLLSSPTRLLDLGDDGRYFRAHNRICSGRRCNAVAALSQACSSCPTADLVSTSPPVPAADGVGSGVGRDRRAMRLAVEGSVPITE